MESGTDPALLPMLDVLANEPAKAHVITGYPYRVASIRPRDYLNSQPIDRFHGLWEHLSKTAGWDHRNNHSVLVFEYEGQRLDCMEGISVTMVANAVTELLDADGRP